MTPAGPWQNVKFYQKDNLMTIIKREDTHSTENINNKVLICLLLLTCITWEAKPSIGFKVKRIRYSREGRPFLQ